MGFKLAAGVVGLGSIFSGFGASKNAKAQKKAAKQAAQAEERLYSKWQPKLDSLIDSKKDALFNLGDIFDRYESTGAFGKDNEVAENLRTAQKDFSRLAAGDFSGFEAQLRKSMSDALIGTVGAGSPVGAFSQLAADTKMNYRQTGISTATGLSDFFAQQAQNLLGVEFGIMDQEFDAGYTLDRNRTTGASQANQMAAQQSGMGLMSIGQTLGTIGGAFGQAYGQQQALDIFKQGQQMQQAPLQEIRSIAERPMPQFNVPQYVPQYGGTDINTGWNNPGFNPVEWNRPMDDYFNGPGVLPPIDPPRLTVPYAPGPTAAINAMIDVGSRITSS